jgi:hypothetical protein
VIKQNFYASLMIYKRTTKAASKSEGLLVKPRAHPMHNTNNGVCVAFEFALSFWAFAGEKNIAVVSISHAIHSNNANNARSIQRTTDRQMYWYLDTVTSKEL